MYVKETHNCNDISINSLLRIIRAFLYHAMDNGNIPSLISTLCFSASEALRLNFVFQAFTPFLFTFISLFLGCSNFFQFMKIGMYLDVCSMDYAYE